MPYPVTVSFGRPMPSVSIAIDVRRAVQELQVDAFQQRKRRMKTLDRSFVRTARRYPLRFTMADGKTPKVTFGSALTKTSYIARRLRQKIGEQEMTDLLLPPSVGGALANFAPTLLGRVLVNLNYTSSNQGIASCAKQCGLDVVVTSRALVECFPDLAIPGRTVFLEDALQAPRIRERLAALALACIMPQAFLRKGQAYMRRCSPENFGSLQYVMVGAEKLPERVALAFEDTLGIRPLEGTAARNAGRWSQSTDAISGQQGSGK